MIRHDYHAHSQFSDGSEMAAMVRAAAAAGLAGIGIADHCIVFEDEFGRRDQFDLVETYERRRERIAEVREEFDVAVFDAAEVSYHPDHEAATRSFLREAEFDYVVGSVHFTDEFDVTATAPYVDLSEGERRAAVDDYFDRQVALVESGLFDVVAHLDLPERVGPLRGLATEDHYRRVARALADSETVPEVNAGRAFGDYGSVHPNPAFLDAFREEGVSFVTGTDAHTPGEVERRGPYLAGFVEGSDVALASLRT